MKKTNVKTHKFEIKHADLTLARVSEMLGKMFYCRDDGLCFCAGIENAFAGKIGSTWIITIVVYPNPSVIGFDRRIFYDDPLALFAGAHLPTDYHLPKRMGAGGSHA